MFYVLYIVSYFKDKIKENPEKSIKYKEFKETHIYKILKKLTYTIEIKNIEKLKI